MPPYNLLRTFIVAGAWGALFLFLTNITNTEATPTSPYVVANIPFVYEKDGKTINAVLAIDHWMVVARVWRKVVSDEMSSIGLESSTLTNIVAQQLQRLGYTADLIAGGDHEVPIEITGIPAYAAVERLLETATVSNFDLRTAMQTSRLTSPPDTRFASGNNESHIDFDRLLFVTSAYSTAEASWASRTDDTHASILRMHHTPHKHVRSNPQDDLVLLLADTKNTDTTTPRLDMSLYERYFNFQAEDLIKDDSGSSVEKEESEEKKKKQQKKHINNEKLQPDWKRKSSLLPDFIINGVRSHSRDECRTHMHGTDKQRSHRIIVYQTRGVYTGGKSPVSSYQPTIREKMTASYMRS